MTTTDACPGRCCSAVPGHASAQVARVVAVSDHTAPLIARAGDLAGELALAAAAAQQLQSVTFVVGRSHLT